MILLYADENFPLPAVQELRRLSYDVLTTSDAGQDGQAIPDEDVLHFASAQQRVLLTLNRKDFIRLHSLHPEHAGIIVCTFDPDFAALAHRIHAAIDSLASTPNVAGFTGLLGRVTRPSE